MDMDVKPLGLEKIPATPAEILGELAEVKVPEQEQNLFGIDDLLDIIKFLLSLVNSYTAAMKDKKITFADALLLWEPAKLIIPAFKGLSNIPLELRDKITDEEMAQVIDILKGSDILPERQESVAIETLELVNHLKNYIYGNFIK